MREPDAASPALGPHHEQPSIRQPFGVAVSFVSSHFGAAPIGHDDEASPLHPIPAVAHRSRTNRYERDEAAVRRELRDGARSVVRKAEPLANEHWRSGNAP